MCVCVCVSLISILNKISLVDRPCLNNVNYDILWLSMYPGVDSEGTEMINLISSKPNYNFVHMFKACEGGQTQARTYDKRTDLRLTP
jgi:hypothetical protein